MLANVLPATHFSGSPIVSLNDYSRNLLVRHNANLLRKSSRKVHTCRTYFNHSLPSVQHFQVR